MRTKCGLILLIVLALSLLGGCGMGLPVTTARYAYVTTAQGISAYTVDPKTGGFTEIAGSPFATTTSPRAVAIDPSNIFAFVGDSRGVSVYRIDSKTGALSEIAGSPFAAGSISASVVVHPSGKFVYVVNASLGSVYEYRVADNGALSQLPGSPVSVGTLTLNMAIAPSGRFAYVPDCQSDIVHAYQIDPATGSLGNPTSATAGTHVCGVAVDPSTEFAYVASSGGPRDFDQPGVWSFKIDRTSGSLAEIGHIAAGSGPNSATVHPQGKFVYVTNFNSNDVSMFTIDASGALAANGSVATGDNPASLVLDPEGKFAYVPNRTGNVPNLFMYSVDSGTGKLVPGNPIPTPGNPTSVAITDTLIIPKGMQR